MPPEKVQSCEPVVNDAWAVVSPGSIRNSRRFRLFDGEGAGAGNGVACDRVWEVVALQDGGDELAAAAHAGPVEYRLQMIVHSVGGQVQGVGDLAGRPALADQVR